MMCSVNTPTKMTGVGAGKAADLAYWEGAARMIASVSTSSKIIVEKSTVPVKTAEAIGKVSITNLFPARNRNLRTQRSRGRNNVRAISDLHMLLSAPKRE